VSATSSSWRQDGAADRPSTGGTADYITFFRVDQAADGSYVAVEIPGLGQAVPTGVGSVSYTAEIATGKAGLDILAQQPLLFDGKHVLWLTDSGSTTSTISFGTYRAKKFYPGTVVRQLCELVDRDRPAAARTATVMHVFSHVADSSDEENDGAHATPPSTPPPDDGVLNISKHVDRAAGDAVKDVGHQLTPLTAVDENRIVSREMDDSSVGAFLRPGATPTAARRGFTEAFQAPLRRVRGSWRRALQSPPLLRTLWRTQPGPPLRRHRPGRPPHLPVPASPTWDHESHCARPLEEPPGGARVLRQLHRGPPACPVTSLARITRASSRALGPFGR